MAGLNSDSNAARPAEIVPVEAADSFADSFAESAAVGRSEALTPFDADSGAAVGRVYHAGHDPLIGRVLEQRYELEELIGEGAMGRVYRGRQLRLRRDVAVKVPKRELTANATFMSRFEREALTMARLLHENIVTVYDVRVAREPGQLSYIAMEYVSGTELDQFLRTEEENLTVRAVLDVFAQLARGLDAAHAAGVVHRDIKPANMIVTLPKRTAKIMDFGIAKAELGDADTLKTCMALGTPAYMAPEQINGEAVTSAADIYAFGVTLYHVLARALPYDSTTMESVLLAHLSQESIPLSERNPAWPEALDGVLAQALARNPERRPPTASRLVQDMTDALQDFRDSPFSQFFRPEHARNVYRRRRSDNRRRQLRQWAGGMLAAALVAVAIIGVAAFLNDWRRGDDAGSAAPLPAHAPTRTNPPASPAAKVAIAPPERVEVASPEKVEVASPEKIEVALPEKVEIVSPAPAPAPPVEPGELIQGQTPELENQDAAPSPPPIAAPSPALVTGTAATSETQPAVAKGAARAIEVVEAPGEAIKVKSPPSPPPYQWGPSPAEKERKHLLQSIDQFIYDRIRAPIIRNRLETAREAFQRVPPEDSAPFFAKLAAVRRTHRDLSTRFTLLDSRLDQRRAELMYRAYLKGTAHGVKGATPELAAEFNVIATFAREKSDWKLIGWKTFIAQ